MHTHLIETWRHDHSFGQEEVRAAENSTRLVIIITGVMMIVEILAGIIFGSMALLADGIHMGSHTVALGISFAAYFYTRKYARDYRFSFGTGKVNGLAGYTSAIILVIFAISMAWTSIERFFHPVVIIFNQAILVAVFGLIVNVTCLWILNLKQPYSRYEDHPHIHLDHPSNSSDHNIKAAYIHVMADALTSVFAILALICGKYLGLVWVDPMMGIVGAVLVARWSVGLLRDTSQILLDQQVTGEIRDELIVAIESQDDTRICDLHLWSIGPGIFAAIISVVSTSHRTPEEYKKLIPDHLRFVHTTIEVHPCKEN